MQKKNAVIVERYKKSRIFEFWKMWKSHKILGHVQKIFENTFSNFFVKWSKKWEILTFFSGGGHLHLKIHLFRDKKGVKTPCFLTKNVKKNKKFFKNFATKISQNLQKREFLFFKNRKKLQNFAQPGYWHFWWFFDIFKMGSFSKMGTLFLKYFFSKKKNVAKNALLLDKTGGDFSRFLIKKPPKNVSLPFFLALKTFGITLKMADFRGGHFLKKWPSVNGESRAQKPKSTANFRAFSEGGWNFIFHKIFEGVLH